jgi:hypothetical protein
LNAHMPPSLSFHAMQHLRSCQKNKSDVRPRALQTTNTVEIEIFFPRPKSRRTCYAEDMI